MESSSDLNTTLKQIIDEKNEANKAYAKNDFLLARKKYSQLIHKIRMVFPEGYKSYLPPGATAEMRKKFVDIQVLMYSNISQVYINEKEYKLALERAEDGLKICPDHIKLLFKKAKIFGDIKDYKQSLKILEDTIKMTKDEDEKRAFVIEIERVKQTMKADDESKDQRLKGFLKGEVFYDDKEKQKDDQPNVKLAY